MSSPNWTDGEHLAPPSAPKKNVTQSTIMIEPTDDSQRFYNQTRREMDKQRLEIHLAENNLEPPHAELMSRSTTSDSHPSPSTVCSHAGDSTIPMSPDPTTEAARSKPHRGRRKGPLDMETRTKTAFKRKFKLTCAFHRAKRTSCNCHDFSKLEEGYRRSLATEGQKTKASRSPSVRPFGDIGTFGTGGAGGTGLTTPQYQSFDLPDLSTSRELTPHVHANLLPVLGLDIDSAASVNAIVSAPREEPFFLASSPVMPIPISVQDEEDYWPVIIGRSTPFRNRWECRYQSKTEETGSQPSNNSQCPWTGPFDQLCAHFSSVHHPFQPALAPHSTLCDECDTWLPEWVEELDCPHPGSSTKLFHGIISRQPNPNPPMLTVSEASGSRSSWLHPSWHLATPGSSNTEKSNLPYSSSTSGFYEHSACGNESSEIDDDEGKDDTNSVKRRCRYESDAVDITRHYPFGSFFSSPGSEAGAGPVFYGPYLSLTRPSKPCRRLILSLLAPLIVLHLQQAHFLSKVRATLLAFLVSVHCIILYLAVMTMLGPLVAWIILDSHRSRANGQVSNPARSRGQSRTDTSQDGLRALVPVV
ncbi:hypothetical protein F5Y09DRAFT_188932 [Xylaria sp. FL1042]|nr:hypothetical protein F5Y09DRAFT_188932 [Xylaria sp. FL1042]